jgi:hypothetical protein
VKLLTDELSARLPPLYSQEAEPDPKVICRFFLPGTRWSWYVTEGSEREGDFLFFGFVVGLDSEFGYFLLSELEAVRSPLFGLPVERDMNFTEGKLTDVVPAPDS